MRRNPHAPNNVSCSDRYYYFLIQPLQMTACKFLECKGQIAECRARSDSSCPRKKASIRKVNAMCWRGGVRNDTFNTQ